MIVRLLLWKRLFYYSRSLQIASTCVFLLDSAKQGVASCGGISEASDLCKNSTRAYAKKYKWAKVGHRFLQGYD